MNVNDNVGANDLVREDSLLIRYGGISRRTLGRWMATKGFPRPVKVGNSVSWYLREIEEYEEANRKRG